MNRVGDTGLQQSLVLLSRILRLLPHVSLNNTEKSHGMLAGQRLHFLVIPYLRLKSEIPMLLMGTCSLGKFSVCGHCVTLSSALAYSGGKAIKDLTGRLSLRSVMYLPEGFPHKPLKPSGLCHKTHSHPSIIGIQYGFMVFEI